MSPTYILHIFVKIQAFMRYFYNWNYFTKLYLSHVRIWYQYFFHAMNPITNIIFLYFNHLIYSIIHMVKISESLCLKSDVVVYSEWWHRGESCLLFNTLKYTKHGCNTWNCPIRNHAISKDKRLEMMRAVWKSETINILCTN